METTTGGPSLELRRDFYDLQHLLPAGVVRIRVDRDYATGSGSQPFSESASWNPWHTVSGFLQAQKLHTAGASTLRFQELEYLARFNFLRATWRIHPLGSLLFVRVYLIPFDLPGAQGRLSAHIRGVSALIAARKNLIPLLKHTDRSIAAWTGSILSDTIFEPLFSQEPDTRTLSEIYDDLSSPSIDPSTFLSGTDERTQRTLRCALEWQSPPGMRPLYLYQRRTVARMLQQEIDSGYPLDPLYIPVHGVAGSNKLFYLHPSNMELLSERPVCSQARGGILCEEMGTGKTCIVLGLILATKHRISAPEIRPTDTNIPTVLTSVALRYFPYSQFESARKTARMYPVRIREIPSLVEMLTHFIRTSPEFVDHGESAPVRRLRHISEALKHSQPFYHVYEPLPETVSQLRRFTSYGPRKIYLTSATLVVVPKAILRQWNSEINKHCEDGSLRVLILDSENSIPSAQKLASEYDIILLTHEKFASEGPRCRDVLSLHSSLFCECPLIEETRVPRCICKQDLPVSPMIQIRWKRLVVDEGHVSASKNHLSWMCQHLSVESRWIVSGTPTRNLMGLSLGQAEMKENSTDGNKDEGIYDDDEGIEDEPSTSDLSYKGTVFGDDPSYGSAIHYVHPRRWTSVDRSDLVRLGKMIADIVAVPRFAYDKDLFQKRVIAPLMERDGPSYGATQVLTQVMSLIMFRHRIQDVERELPEKLPPLKEKTVALKFRPLAAKTYNVLQAGIAVNAVDSEREGQDYFFHPRARKQLLQTLENITQTMFWKTDDNVFDIDQAVKRTEEALIKARERGRPQSDISLIENALRVQREALDDSFWKEVMRHVDCPHVVTGLSPGILRAWLKINTEPPTDQNILDPERLCRLRDLILRNPFIQEERIIYEGSAFRDDEEAIAMMQQRSQGKKKSDDYQSGGLKVKKLKEDAESSQKQAELNRELTAAIHRRESGEDYSSHQIGPIPPSIGTFPSVFVGSSASAKLDYVLRKVLKHASKHKFLIFSAFPLSLAYIKDALDLAQVPCLAYVSHVKPRARQSTVVTFETSDTYRVLLMELKLGARGLNLLSASRIIFCEPVWQADVESQAIKRAHRIGQKCSVLKVVTLVMKGTSEEAMITRRHILHRKLQRMPPMEEDSSMSKFLQNPTFISPDYIESPEDDGIRIPLIPRPNFSSSRLESLSTQTSTNQKELASKDMETTALDRPPSKKIKMVHFG